ncbi:uncharacterized protein LOC112349087 isoform X2 [Selaginella moellendorffii]|uniref:uncharacterized protein LOC112349087 isoform X2 n=1 Tax=Selaginella moellendorffii TaxID=88036 RepID=UPI000D1C657B|nr:uncharacterized protein LOC112349087 isoform X2 [Selaginella moellendorffii]|eukprot:XP_024538587.1 uncharacterized protein LOC112349087 isoform X2 [Selaginella moellendorffii]
MEVAPPICQQHQQRHSCGDEIFAFRAGEAAGGTAVAPSAATATDSSNKFDLALPEKNCLTSNFTIRGFVSLVRKQDIRQTWPFSEELLQRYLSEGKSLPHLDATPPTSVATVRASSGEDEVDARAVVTEVVHPGEQELEVQFHFENQARDGSKGLDGPGEESKRMEAGVSLVASETLAAGKTGGEEGEAKDKGLDCIEDKASDTGAEEVEAIQGSAREDDAGASKPATGDDGVGEDGQQQNVCPVCASFSCHSVTALNAHIDGCLSAAPGTDKCQRVVALRSTNTTANNKGSCAKVQKMRSITDIIAADPAPSPKSDSTAKHAEPVVRERRAPNHVVVLADKEAAVSKSSSGQAQRNLRSRSRGSRSMILVSPIKPDAGERAARRRRRECTGNCVQKSGEWSEPHKKMRHCSGNSVEVTSSWTPSISSGTYCHSKAQDNLEKSCELSESHGSANCLDPSSLQPAGVEQEKTPEKAKRSACTGPVNVTDDSSSNKADCEKPQGVEAPTRTDTSIDAPDALPPPDTQIPEGPPVPAVVESKADADRSAEGAKACMEAANPDPPPADPAVVATSAPPAVSTAAQSENAVQRPRSIPLYDSMISSLRSTSVDSVTGYSHFNNPTWKAAVVMATLGASLAKTNSTPSTPASVVTSIGNSEASAPRVDLCSQASDSICVSVVPVVEASSKAGPYNRDNPVSEAKATATDRVAFKETGVHGYYQALPGRVSALDKSKFPFQNVGHPTEAVQCFPSSSTKIPKVPGWMQGGDRAAVIDVDQVSFKAQASSSDAKAEKPVLRLLGQNVMVESGHKDVQGAKSPYSFSVPGVHAAATGYHTPCCCSSRSAAPAEHIAFALGKEMPVPYTSNSAISQIPLPGTWRLLPNGILSQVNGHQINLGSAKLGGAPLNCCLHKSCSQQHQPQQQQQPQKVRPGGDQKNAGDLPPWLLAAKKQKEAEANVIVIDDDDADEEKASPTSVSKAAVIAKGGASPSEVEFTGERSVRPSDKSTSARLTYAPGTASPHKREAGGDWTQQPHEKAAKITTSDSPQVANRMGIPVLVPTWMISSSDSSGSVNQSKRGATAQAYKARIAMMKAYMHSSGDANPAQIHQQQQRSLPPGSCVYQLSQQQGAPRLIPVQAPLGSGNGGGGGSDLLPGYITHGGGGGLGQHHHQLYQQQQQLSLLVGKDCHIIELEDGQQCLLVNGHMMEAAEQQQQMITVAAAAESAAAVAAAAAAAESMALGKRLVRDASGRSFVLCNDGEGGGGGSSGSGSAGRGGESGAKILVTPVLPGDGSGYHGIVLAGPGTSSTSSDHHHHHHGHHHHHHHQIATAATPSHAVLPLSIVQQQQQQQQQIKILQSQMRAADKGVMCSWSYGQKS